MFEASKAMTKEVITVSPETPVLEVAHLLIKHRISGLPVVDASGDLVGIISEKDLLRLLFDADSILHNVSDFMTKDVVSFQDSESVVKICQFLIKSNVRRVPIVAGQKLVGVVSRRDIIFQILNMRGQSISE